MRTRLARALPCVLVVVLLLEAVPARAGLIVRAPGLVYDDDLNITWLQNADYFSTGPRARGWDEAIALVANLDYLGFSDWRLPRTSGSGTGYLNEGELAHLYYTELGNVPGGIGFSSGPFFNIQRGRYWTETPSGSDSAFTFFLAEDVSMSGWQDADLKTHGNNIWALRDGDVPVQPVPDDASSLLLFGASLSALVALRTRWR